MHMADALVSISVGVTMGAVSAGILGYSSKKIKMDFDEKKVPIMGVMSAFVFAGQMINFTIPGTGASGHIGGAVLLAALIGEGPAFISMAAVLLIQALFFADGGLLAYGCNLFNMGFFACYIAFPLIYKKILKKKITSRRIWMASVIACTLGLQLGSFAVVLETTISGITELPFAAFALLMQPIHLVIGIIEGIITGAVLCFVYEIRPEIMEGVLEEKRLKKEISVKKTVIVFALAMLLVGGGLSLFASANPDGLEWAMEGTAGTTEFEQTGSFYRFVEKIQEKTAWMPDYVFATESSEHTEMNAVIPGVFGGVLTLGISSIIAFTISRVKKRRIKEINV